jgi:predicted DNA-binding transcriptional regulator YafY
LARYWADSLARFERELYKGEATLLATPAGLKALRYLSGAVAKAVAGAPASRRKDGRVRVRIPIESVEHATGQLLRLVPDVEVIEPAALRGSVVGRLREACVRYGLA